MAKTTERKSDDKKPLAPRVAAEIPPLRPGDTVNVQLRITEGDKERIQAFQGTVIAIRGAGRNRSFTVRKASRGFGVERIFPYSTPSIVGVEVKRHAKVRRARLYYLRNRSGREAMLRERRVEGESRPKAVES
ncbi:50S ribosomal protein L19 [candidate division WOR-3 bacterium]|nr:50S ribosomal protein L19 [candidate division WOR-3 bacterium]